MGAAYFYHLTHHPVDVTLAMLLNKSIAAGWRVAVRGTDQQRLLWLDDKLWQGREIDFLPHALAGGSHDTDQPILLTTTSVAGNDPQCLMSIDGAEIEAEEIERLERACIIFDGNDPEYLQIAREQWKRLKAENARAQYWSQESGNWEMKAEM